jgi:hypothetical protein
MTTMTPERIAAMATVALTYPGSNVVNVRMQTEHLHAVEQDLGERGVPTDLVAEHFDDLHCCAPLPLDIWLGAITAAYNQAIEAAADQ